LKAVKGRRGLGEDGLFEFSILRKKIFSRKLSAFRGLSAIFDKICKGPPYCIRLSTAIS
jgi:hypothetical protein